MKEDDLHRFSLLLLRSIPPELMSIWMWGWNLRFLPEVWQDETMAGRKCLSLHQESTVSLEALKREVSKNLYSSRSSLSSWGTVKQIWWKPVGGKSSSIFFTHLSVRTLPQELQKRVLQEWGTIIYWSGCSGQPFVITQFLGVTAREHLLYCPDDILTKRVFIPG